MKVSEVVSVLRRASIFSDIDDRALNILAFSGESLPFSAGDVLVKKGDRTRSALVILSGELAVDPDGRAPPVACGPSTVIGELALLAGRNAAATVTATGDGEALRIDRALFEKAVSEFPEIAARLRHGMLERMGTMMRDLAGLEAKLRTDPEAVSSRRTPRSPERGRRGAASPAPPPKR